MISKELYFQWEELMRENRIFAVARIYMQEKIDANKQTIYGFWEEMGDDFE